MGGRVNIPAHHAFDTVNVVVEDPNSPERLLRPLRPQYREIGYIVSPSGIIRSVLTPREWGSFAAQAGADLPASSVIGRSLYSYISSTFLQAFYQNVIRNTQDRDKHTPFKFIYFCDCGNIRREMVMVVDRTPAGDVLFRSFTVHESVHVAPFLDTLVFAISGERCAAEACPFCNRFLFHHEWLLPAEYQQHVHGALGPVGHRVCPSCLEHVLRPLGPFSHPESSRDNRSKLHLFFLDEDRAALAVYEALSVASNWSAQVSTDPGRLRAELADPESTVDVLVVDMCLPRVSGVDLLRQLSQQRLLRCAVVGTSFLRDHRQNMLDAGCAAFIEKPVCRSMLQKAVASALRRQRRGSRQHRRSNSPSPPGTPEMLEADYAPSSMSNSSSESSVGNPFSIA